MIFDMRKFKSFPQFKARFLSYLPINYQDDSMIDSCWNWRGNKLSKNYVRIKYGKDSYQAHRISYIIFKDLIPYGKIVRHTCDNPRCVNPKHLLLDTQTDNFKDMTKRNRHAHQKLNSEAVKVIKWMLKYRPEKTLVSKLANLYNVTPSNISAIKRNISWSWIKV